MYVQPQRVTKPCSLNSRTTYCYLYYVWLLNAHSATATCTYCLGLDAGRQIKVRTNLQGLYDSADTRCPTCTLLVEIIKGLISRHVELKTEYFLSTPIFGLEAPGLHGGSRKAERNLILRLNKSFEFENDITIYSSSGEQALRIHRVRWS